MIPSGLAAQGITGRVMDATTNAGIERAIVTLLNLDLRPMREVVTSGDGNFFISVPMSGRYQVRARAIGYAPTTSPVLDILESGDEVVRVDFLLKSSAVPLPPIDVTGPPVDVRLSNWGYYDRKETYGKEGMGFGHFLDGEALRPTATRVSDLMRDLPGIRVSGAGGRRVGVTGRRGCTPVFYLDGTRVVGGIEDMTIPSDIVAIEVYPGSVVPMEYLVANPSSSSCGVVAVWTGLRGNP